MRPRIVSRPATNPPIAQRTPRPKVTPKRRHRLLVLLVREEPPPVPHLGRQRPPRRDQRIPPARRVRCRASRAFFDERRQAGWQMEAGQGPRSACRKKEGERPAAGEAKAGITSRRSSQGACGPRACRGGESLPGPPTVSVAAATCRTPRSRPSAPRRRRAGQIPSPKGRGGRAEPRRFARRIAPV